MGRQAGVLGALAALHGSLEDMCQASSQLMRRILVAPWMSVALYRRWGRHGFLLGGEGARQPTDQGEQSCCRDSASGHDHLRSSWVGAEGRAPTLTVNAHAPMSHGTPRVTPL